MKIIDRIIGENSPVFIIAEAGVNHNGNLKFAKQLIDAAANAGADAIKFQTWDTDKILLDDVQMVEYQKKNTHIDESQFQMLEKLELPYEWHFELKEYAEKLDLVFFSTMEDKESVDFLMTKLKIPLIKVGSGDLTNYSLLKYTARFKKPMILSTGMATLSEIDEAVRIVREEGIDYPILLQCTTQYPCPYSDINLKAINSLKQTFNTTVGFSDHSLGIECAIASVAMGARCIEKHITLDRKMVGPDHKASLEPNDFRRMVESIRNVENALGDGFKRPMLSELKNKRCVTRKIVASEDINKGDILNDNKLTFKRANYGLDSKYYQLIEGKRTRECIKQNEIITFEMLE